MNIIKLLLSIIICQLAGVVGAIFTTPQIKGWYSGLNKPSFNPPSWIFGPVWTTLFILMGVSLYLVWIKGDKTIKARNMFALQLVLNMFWSIIFFHYQSPGIAFAELILLWLVIILTIIKFYKFSKPAAYLLFPYILWVSFAGVLNYFIWILN